MRAFRFRFEPVLRQREARLEAARTGLGRAISAHTAAITTRDDCVTQIDQAIANVPTRGVIDPSWVLLRQRHVHGLRGELDACERAVSEAEAEVERARVAVCDAHRDVQVMEKMCARDFEAWRTATRRAEEMAIDEVTAQRFARERR